MRKTKRFNFIVTDEIIGKDFESAQEICKFNGYLLSNNNIGTSYSLLIINYEMEDGKIIKAYLKN